jgi:hypothetical protein
VRIGVRTRPIGASQLVVSLFSVTLEALALWQTRPGAEKLDIAAEIDAARNAILAMSPEERASHLKRTAERMPEWPRKIGDPGHHAICALGPQSADRSVMHSKRPGDIS